MKSIRFFLKRFIWTMGKLCQQRWLLAGLVLLCLFLPLTLGTMAQQVLSEGIDFSGIRLAVTAGEGDRLPELVAQYIGRMTDVSRYCTVVAMEESEALSALEEGEVTAVLRLPENFVKGVVWGENPDVQVILSGEQPLEALLTLWVGQSGTDLLSAVQAGIYAVLDIYDAAPVDGLTRDQVVNGINLEYISWTMNRQSLFWTEEISAAGVLPVKEHYAVCLLAYFSLALAPLFMPLYRGSWFRFQRRLRAAGRSGVGGYAASVLAAAVVLLLLLVPGLLLTGGGVTLPLLLAALAMAVFAAVFGSFCCLVTGNAAGCGVVAFLVSLLSLFLAGGVVPPALLPRSLRRLSALSPVRWLADLAGRAMGYETEGTLLCCGLVLVGMAAVAGWLYCLRLSRKEDEP